MTSLLDQTNVSMDQIEIDQNKDYLAELVGDNRKFKTQQDLAKGKYMADSYIEILLREKEERTKSHLDLMRDYESLRNEYNARGKLEDYINQINKTDTSRSSDNTSNANDDQKPAIDKNEIASLIDTRLTEREKTQRADNNFNQVKLRLKEILGSNYQTLLEKRIEELGLSVEQANELARQSPSAFFKTFDLEAKPLDTFQAPPRSMHTPFKPAGPQKRTWAYYQELKKNNPKAWLDPKISVQMQKDSIELGEAFRDGDYYVSGLHE